MQNPDEIERFWAEYQKGQNSMVTVYEIHQDGVILSLIHIFTVCRNKNSRKDLKNCKKPLDRLLQPVDTISV